MNKRCFRFTFAAIAAAAITVLSAGTGLAAVFQVGFGNAQFGSSLTPVVSPSPLDVTQSGGVLNGNHTFASARGVADAGLLSNQVNMARTASQFGATGRPWVQTLVTFDDVRFFREDDPLAGGFANIGVSTDYSVSVDGPLFRAEFSTAIGFTNSGGASSGSQFITGGSSATGSVLLNIANVPLNVPQSMTVRAYLELSMIETFVPSITGSAISQVLFPTFVLPEGIGVTSALLPMSSVPAPMAVALLGFGLVGLGRIKRLR